MKVERVLSYEFFALQQQSLHVRAGEGTAPVSGSISFSLDCTSARSPVLAAFFEGIQGSISGQIALKMALTATVSAAMASASDGGLDGVEIVRAVLKEVNKEVYEYGHRMFIGGKVAGTGTVAVFDGEKFSVARVGPYDSFLYRGGELLQFHRVLDETTPSAGVLERFLGANVQVLADIASATVQDGDMAVIFNCSLPADLMQSFEQELKENEGDLVTAFRIVFQRRSALGFKRRGQEELSSSPLCAAYGFRFCTTPEAVR